MYNIGIEIIELNGIIINGIVILDNLGKLDGIVDLVNGSDGVNKLYVDIKIFKMIDLIF